MTAIAGTITYRTTVTAVAASSGDGDLIAALFNGITFPRINAAAACTATNASGTVTIYWPQATTQAGNGLVLDFVSKVVAADTALAQTPLLTVGTQVAIT